MWFQKHEWKKLAKMTAYSLGSFACPILALPLLFNVKKRANKVLVAPDPKHEPLCCVDLGHEKHEDEEWFFLNGSCTTKDLHYANASHIADLFKRKINLLHNPTQRLLIDLLEWLVSRPVDEIYGLAQQLASYMKDSLCSPKGDNFK